jgi:hypothetical protein
MESSEFPSTDRDVADALEGAQCPRRVSVEDHLEHEVERTLVLSRLGVPDGSGSAAPSMNVRC